MPNRRLAIEKYRRQAAAYDESNRFRRLRRYAVDLLELKQGAVVLDAACGSGLNFPLIQSAIGEPGSLLGVDLSPEMLAVARERVAENCWRNVSVICSSVEEARLPDEIDAALFSLSHDVLRSPPALDNVLESLKPGGHIVALGAKWAPWWAWPINLAVWYGARRYTTTFEGFSRPWSHLGCHVPNLKIESKVRGTMYVAWGTKPGAA